MGIKDVSLKINKGEIYGFIGPNGAGKSTTIRCIMGLINKNSGNIYIKGNKFNKNDIDIKKIIGYLPSEINLYGDMTIKEILDYHQAFYNKNLNKRRKELVKLFKIDEKKKIENLSLGNLKKVGNQPKFRYKSPEYVANEIEELITKYGINRLSFTDEDFFGDKAGVERALELFKILIDRNIKIDLHANARAKTVMWLAKNNYLDLCFQGGIKYMYVGLESYNNKSLKLFDKGIITRDIDFVVDELAKHKIRINPGLITFDPTLTLDNVKDNIELYKKINYYDAFIFTRRLVLYPNASPKIQELFKNEEYFQHG